MISRVFQSPKFETIEKNFQIFIFDFSGIAKL
jgi:hypothetical protein